MLQVRRAGSFLQALLEWQKGGKARAKAPEVEVCGSRKRKHDVEVVTCLSNADMGSSFKVKHIATGIETGCG